MNAFLVYVIFGLGVWLGASAARFNLFKTADPKSILKGAAFAILVWPVALMLLVHTSKDKNEANR
jgi:hypothetical protein